MLYSKNKKSKTFRFGIPTNKLIEKCVRSYKFDNFSKQLLVRFAILPARFEKPKMLDRRKDISAQFETLEAVERLLHDLAFFAKFLKHPKILRHLKKSQNKIINKSPSQFQLEKKVT